MSNTTINGTSIIISDNQAHLISLFNSLNKYISQIGLGLILIMGNIGSALTCLVFSQPTFNKSPCAMYFIASSFAQFFTFNFALVTRMIHYGYSITTLNTNLYYCKIRFYLFYIFVAVPRYQIILASIDRYFASSRDAVRRQWSSPKVASRLMIGTAIIWCLIYIQVLIFYDISSGSCKYRSGAYGVFFSTYIAIDSGILPLFLMLVFGLLTVKNIHKTKQRIGPGGGTNENRPAQGSKMSKKDAQLHKMLAHQITLFIVLNLPNPCYLVYSAFTINTPKSSLRTTIEAFASNMTYVLIYLGFSLTFANFATSSEIFRRELLQLIQTKILRQNPTRVTTGGGTTVRGLRPNDGDE
ncbi:unnamed protein product [Adineta steineri]|uniref:G-protein coupled receptors family 1 profile domain-containing protein n=1 Tax=Adineta steineri TaxID=433720 RepID=A0A814TSI1_9BILA|nr:unnamed protein product [Adineta steineri]CAF1379742.1 unnamed protein product [Adineta steineri]